MNLAIDNYSLNKSISDWRSVLASEKESSYFKELIAFIEERRKNDVIVYPSNKNIFKALQLTPLNQVKVVILGQDPYHGAGQAHGLCFSVPDGVQKPPSLCNIFKELKEDLNIPIAQSGSLEKWANQGVLLLNSVLTVESGKPESHANRGWERFTDSIIEGVNSNLDNVVFMLWGSYAQKKGSRIDDTKHLVLKAPHPSPLSAHRGFLGCKHFSVANEWLHSKGHSKIVW